MDPTEAPFAAQQAIATFRDASQELDRAQARIRQARRDLRTLLEQDTPDGTVVEWIATVAPGLRQRVVIDRRTAGQPATVTLGAAKTFDQAAEEDGS